MVSKTVSVVCLLAGYAISSPRSDYSGHYIRPYTQTSWGSWGLTEWCPHGTFASEFDLRIELKQGRDDDDTTLNSIGLHCRQKSESPRSEYFHKFDMYIEHSHCIHSISIRLDLRETEEVASMLQQVVQASMFICKI